MNIVHQPRARGSGPCRGARAGGRGRGATPPAPPRAAPHALRAQLAAPAGIYITYNTTFILEDLVMFIIFF